MELTQFDTPIVIGGHALIDPLRCGFNLISVIEVDSNQWFNWLEQNESFTIWQQLDGGSKLLTCRKRYRGDTGYWYVYARDADQKLRGFYLGKSSDLTRTRLQSRVDGMLGRLGL